MNQEFISTGGVGGAGASKSPTPDYYNVTFSGRKLDPYRICMMYGINGGPQEHAIKKLLRAGNKPGESTLKEIDAVIDALNRWKEIIKEDQST